MGRLKALVPWQGKTLIEYQVESLFDSGVSEVVVVVGHLADQVAAPVISNSGVIIATNPEYRRGKAGSVKAGLARVAPSASGILVLAVDQPRPVSVLESIINSYLASKSVITCPVYNGHRGHPMIFSSLLRSELEAITEEGEGLRQVVDRYKSDTNKLDVGDPVVRLDLNSPDDIKLAKLIFSG
ncbi:uncharacterized protein METZ01_LOCUS157784 [marine metagenome]|jgi:molybdenum cofactor cytidylyltransferase|uniref:MobA-like NTP transferase domain-containing protein n=1 Tax=marine metagenome TaxID=408172 RepID=A0A382ATQ2_9ZZZZ